MRIANLSVGRQETLLFRVLSGDHAKARERTGHDVRLVREPGGTLLVVAQEGTWTVSAHGRETNRRLSDVFDRGLHALHALLSVTESEEGPLLAVQTFLFPDRFALGTGIQIGADRKIIDEARRLAGASDPVAWLDEEFVVRLDLDEAGAPALLVASAGRQHATAPDSFRVFGRTATADLRRDAEGRLFIERLARRRGREPDRLFLLGGTFEVTDLDRTQAVELKHELDALLQAQDSYMSLWVEYNEIEKRQTLAAARDLGWWPYSECHLAPDGAWSFRLDRAEDALQVQAAKDRGLMVEADTRPPLELSDPSGTATPDDDDAWLYAEGPKTFIGTPRSVDVDSRRIYAAGTGAENEPDPPASGVLSVSLLGDRVRLSRRNEAVDRLTSGRAPMARLVHLLEQKPIPFARVHKTQALSKRALALFPHGPNDRQKQAIDVAINTPDLALIQGPPGTGKTQTIAAIQARLAELAEEGDPLAGQILLTSTQHDAVENAAAKTRIYGLPPVKLGSRSGEPEARLSTHVAHWRHELQSRVRLTIEAMGASATPLWAARRELDRLTVRYLKAPTGPESTASLLDDAADIVGPFVPAATGSALRTLARSLRRRPAPAGDAVGRAARGLRVDPVTFEDDGPRTARRLLRALADTSLGTDEDRNLLAQAAEYAGAGAPPFLSRLAELRDRLLDRLADQADDADEHLASADVIAALASAQDALRQATAERPEGVADVLHEFLHELDHDPQEVQDTVKQYAVTLAATCQQAASGKVRWTKLPDGKGDVTFANVVVDEAARSNPLDLFIPMSMAERRLILVGDQNQLPHMLEPDVERAIGEAQDDGEPHELKRSLFERLYDHVLHLEQSDGIQRCVMLDTQYRMHPVLGDFVGGAFYASAGGLNSGRAPSDFHHDLPGYEGKVAAWLDVPPHEGREHPGQSKSRLAEARRLAAELRRLLDHDTLGELSFGVITFYSRQEDLLWQELAAVGIAERRDGDTGYVIRPAYATAQSSDGRLRSRIEIGTVDAFQGKEFDVVLLSAVRSNALPATNESEVRRKYGHLTLPNRLCVAMSRQQRLLIVIADASMVSTEEAATHVPALHAYHALCRGEYGVVRT